MARGFAKGLLQGAILCVAAVAALSLVVPLPQTAAVTDDGAAEGSPGGTGAVSGAVTSAAPAAAGGDGRGDAAGSGPAAQEISLPVGSEFARGDDLQPVAPAPLTRPETAPQTVAPTVTTRPDAAASAPARATAGRPQTGIDAPVAPVAIAPVPEPADLLPAPAQEAPIPIAPPGRVQTPALDRGPEQVPGQGDAAALPRAAQGSGDARPAASSGVAAGVAGAAGPDDASDPRIAAGDDRLPARASGAPPPALVAQDGAGEARPDLADLADPAQSGRPQPDADVDQLPQAPEAALAPARTILLDPLDLTLPPDLGGLGLSTGG